MVHMSTGDTGDELVDVGREVERDGIERAFMVGFPGSNR
jgi:hypothetical protein